MGRGASVIGGQADGGCRTCPRVTREYGIQAVGARPGWPRRLVLSVESFGESATAARFGVPKSNRPRGSVTPMVERLEVAAGPGPHVVGPHVAAHGPHPGLVLVRRSVQRAHDRVLELVDV